MCLTYLSHPDKSCAIQRERGGFCWISCLRSRFSSRRVVHERDTCSKLFCCVSLIERNAIPRDLDFQHQAALLLASPTSASSMMRVQPYCHEESRFTTRRFRIVSH